MDTHPLWDVIYMPITSISNVKENRHAGCVCVCVCLNEQSSKRPDRLKICVLCRRVFYVQMNGGIAAETIEGSGWAAALGEIVRHYISWSEYFLQCFDSEIAQGNFTSTTGTSAIAAKKKFHAKIYVLYSKILSYFNYCHYMYHVHGN